MAVATKIVIQDRTPYGDPYGEKMRAREREDERDGVYVRLSPLFVPRTFLSISNGLQADHVDNEWSGWDEALGGSIVSLYCTS